MVFIADSLFYIVLFFILIFLFHIYLDIFLNEELILNLRSFYMQQYLIIIVTLISIVMFKLIDSKRFKFNKKLLKLFSTIQLIFVFFILINSNEILVINFLEYFKSNFFIFFNKLNIFYK